MHREEIGAAVCIGERNRNRHLAVHRGILRLELVYFNDSHAPVAEFVPVVEIPVSAVWSQREQ